jgi:hypothetical protein
MYTSRTLVAIQTSVEQISYNYFIFYTFLKLCGNESQLMSTQVIKDRERVPNHGVAVPTTALGHIQLLIPATFQTAAKQCP